LRRCDAVIASTTLEQADLEELYGADPKKITVIPPGVDASRFRVPANRSTLRRELGLANIPTVFTLGRLDPRKGFDLFFRAAAKVLDQIGPTKDAQFVLSAGVGEKHDHEIRERDRLSSLVNELGIERSVQWLPVLSQDRLPSYYGASDVFILPSRYELFGIVMLEALACGVPVVATRFGGPPDVIEDGENGRLVDPTDIRATANAVVDLLLHPKERYRMGRRAREQVEQSYSWEALARKHQRLYDADGD